MSSKEERPTLKGVSVKQRKRNIAVPLDPGAFAAEVLTVFEEQAVGNSVEEKLESAVKALDTVNLDFSRYGDTMFEILFAGNRMAAGANLVSDQGKELKTNLLACPPDRKAIYPYVKIFQTLVRRRPFLVKNLENVLVKLLMSLEFFDDLSRQKLAIATSLVFDPSMRIGVLPENILSALANDRLIQRGTILEFITAFFQDFLSASSLDELVAILTRAKVAGRLFDFFPPQKRSWTAMAEHFNPAGLEPLVKWYKKKVIDVKTTELKDYLMEFIDEDTSPEEISDIVKEKAADGELPNEDVLRVVWEVLIKSINMTGKNTQQLKQLLSRTLNNNAQLLTHFASSPKLEAALLVIIQVYCYEDTRLLKLFSEIVRIVYDAEIVGEDTIFYWYRKGSHAKGRNVFLKDIEPFISWLEEAEEEDDDEDED